jgi:RNA polymerase sigma factor FliA
MLQAQIDQPQLTYGRKPSGLRPEDMVRSHGQMVRRIAWQVHSRMSTAIEIEDLIQIGLVALVESARTFEDRGIAFGPYALTRARGAMIDELRRDARMARAGMARRRQVAKVRNLLENRFMRTATDAEMAAEMSLSAEEYFAIIASTQAARQESIDDTYSDHDPMFADGTVAVDTQIETSEMCALLARCISELNEREALTLQLYFVEEMNLDEIGKTLGVGAPRACQIKKAALQKLRVRLVSIDFG